LLDSTDSHESCIPTAGSGQSVKWSRCSSTIGKQLRMFQSWLVQYLKAKPLLNWDPGEVGYKLSKARSHPDSGREGVMALESNGKIYYLLEYAVKLPNQQERHNLASVAISRGKLYLQRLCP